MTPDDLSWAVTTESNSVYSSPAGVWLTPHDQLSPSVRVSWAAPPLFESFTKTGTQFVRSPS